MKDKERRVKKIRLSDEAFEAVKIFQHREGYNRAKAYGELIKKGLKSQGLHPDQVEGEKR